VCSERKSEHRTTSIAHCHTYYQSQVLRCPPVSNRGYHARPVSFEPMIYFEKRVTSSGSSLENPLLLPVSNTAPVSPSILSEIARPSIAMVNPLDTLPVGHTVEVLHSRWQRGSSCAFTGTVCSYLQHPVQNPDKTSHLQLKSP
jgi:hypothetical protein